MVDGTGQDAQLLLSGEGWRPDELSARRFYPRRVLLLDPKAERCPLKKEAGHAETAAAPTAERTL